MHVVHVGMRPIVGNCKDALPNGLQRYRLLITVNAEIKCVSRRDRRRGTVLFA